MQRHWGSEIDLKEKSLPTLKFQFIQPYILAKNIKILEIGSGNGKVLHTIHKLNKTAKLYGCDINDVKKPKYNFTQILKDTTKLPYKDKYFDVVVCMDVIEHVKEYKRYIREIKRILKPGGIFCGFCPCEGNTFSSYSLAKLILGKNIFIRTKEHVNSFKTDHLEFMLNYHFEKTEYNYSYHILGQIMDATLYSLMIIPKVEKLFWNENKYYNKKKNINKSFISKVFNELLTLANGIAYFESYHLKHVRSLSTGLHFKTIRKVMPDE